MFGFGNRTQAQNNVQTNYRLINRNNFIVTQGKQFLEGNIISDNTTAIVRLSGNILPVGMVARVQVRKSIFGNKEVNTTIYILDDKDRTIAKKTLQQTENDDISVMLNAAIDLAYQN